MRKVLLPILGAASLTLAAGPAAAQAARTWVSHTGDDANACDRPTVPCRTFAGALAKTAPGGEISVVNPGGYGGLTINKSVTVNALWGGEAGVLVAQGIPGVVITAAATDVVVLRGLYIKGLGTGSTGIRIRSAAAVHIQECVIEDFRSASGTGISVLPAAGTVELTVSDTVIQNNGAAGAGGGMVIRPTGPAVVRATLTRVEVLNNSNGVLVDGDDGTGAIDVTIRESDISMNSGQGLQSRSPNAGDALVRVAISGSTVASNGAAGVQSAGQRSTVRIGGSTVMGNAGAGLQANSYGVLQSYGDNYTEGNGAANVGVTPAPPS